MEKRKKGANDERKTVPPPKTDKRDGWLKKLLRWISEGNKKAYKNGCPT